MNYKAVILGNTRLSYSWFVLTHRQGLKLNGWDVLEIDYKSTPLNEIKKKILDYKPNVIFTHLSFHSHIHSTTTILNFFKDIKNKINVKIIHTVNDARIKDRFMGDIRGSFDAAFVGTYPMVNGCQTAFKVPVFYSPYSALCYDKMADFTPDLAFKKLVFTGSPNAHRTGWKDNRADFIERLQKQVPLKIFRTQSGQDLRKRTPELSVSCSSVLAACVGYEIEGYIDVRPWQYLGTGACMIMRKFNRMDELIPDDLYWEFKDYSNDSIMQIKELRQRALKEDTSEMRKKAFDFVQKYHSSEVRMKNILACIEEKQNTTKSLMKEFL